ALDALAKLRRSRLGDSEWVVLARELVRGFARRAELHPLPELVTLFFPPAAAAPGQQAKLLEALAGRRPAEKLSGSVSAAVVLWPFVQALASSPGAPEELFLLCGQGRRGARLVAPPLGFEHFDEDLWRKSVLFSSDTELVTASEQDRPPFRGLSAFRAEDAG